MFILANPETSPPLDESLYSLDGDELEFFRYLTGIQDENAVKAHVIAVQTKAYAIYGYPCIRSFSFLKLKIARLPGYKHALNMSRHDSNATFLDLGCCFGNDIRKAVQDGWPVNRVIASDLRQGFWDFGHELFKSTPQSFPAAFVPGDIFDSAILSERAPFYELPTSPLPDLQPLTSLTPLQGHIRVIFAASFFHLFNEDRQKQLAERIASLLSPVSGSMIFGSHVGAAVKGRGPSIAKQDVFCHSPGSWCELWDGQIFTRGTVKVDAYLKAISRPDLGPHEQHHLLIWSVTRL